MRGKINVLDRDKTLEQLFCLEERVYLDAVDSKRDK